MAASKQWPGVHGGDDRHGRLAVAAEHRLQQVGLLGLGGQAGGGAAALDVDDDQRQLQARRPGRSSRDLRAMPGPEVVVTPSAPPKDGADGGADAGDLVLGLEGADAEVLVLGQLVQDVARPG